MREVLDLLHRVHLGLVENARGTRVADAVDIGQRDIRALVARKIDACNIYIQPYDKIYVQ